MDKALVIGGVPLSLNNENQAGSAFGHVATTISESFWARLSRYGRPKYATSQASAVSASTFTTLATLTPSIGNILFPRYASISCNQSATVYVGVTSGVDLMNNSPITYDPIYRIGRIPANGVFQVYFDGELWATEWGSVQLRIIADTSGTAWCTVDGIEVAPDA